MSDLITIPERMHTVAEVATLAGHQPGYIVRLIDRGELDAVRPANPRGGKGQWRIYPGSIRRWLGIKGERSERARSRRAAADDAAYEAMMGE